MNTLKKLRKQTGFSQYKIADWLGISRSYINMAERGLRELPKEASDKLLAVLLFIEKNKGAGKISISPGLHDKNGQEKMAKLAEQHQKKMERCLFNVRGLQIRLNKLKKKHEAIDARFIFLDALHATEIKKTAFDRKWIEFMNSFTKEQPAKSYTEQQILQDRIDLLSAYAEIHKKHFQKFSI